MKGADVLLTSMSHLCLQAPGWNCVSPLQWLVIVHLKGTLIHNVNENVPQSHGSHCSAKVLTVQVVLYKSTAVKALSALF